MAQEIIRVGHSDLTARIFGVCDAHVKELEKAFGVFDKRLNTIDHDKE